MQRNSGKVQLESGPNNKTSIFANHSPVLLEHMRGEVKIFAEHYEPFLDAQRDQTHIMQGPEVVIQVIVITVIVLENVQVLVANVAPFVAISNVHYEFVVGVEPLTPTELTARVALETLAVAIVDVLF